MKRVQLSHRDQRNGQWLKGVLDLCLLGALRDGEAYGYQLSRILEQAGMGVIKGGTLYPVLNRLETDGLLDVTWRASEKGPDRKYYTLTDAGWLLLEETGKEWTLFAQTTADVISGEAKGGAA